MSSAKHTPGPWKTSRAKSPSDGAYDYAIGADFGDQTLAIAEAFGRVDDDIYPNAEANSHLIAAAPDMLEALTRLLDINDNGGPFGGEIYQDRVDRAWDAARAAIAKAEGTNG